MWLSKLHDLLVSTPDEAQGRRPLSAYLRYWIVAALVAGILSPFVGMISALMAASPIAFTLLLVLEITLSKAAFPESKRCSVVCRATMFFIFGIVLPASAVLNAAETLSQSHRSAVDEDILPTLVSGYLIMPLILIVSVYFTRQLRRDPLDRRK